MEDIENDLVPSTSAIMSCCRPQKGIVRLTIHPPEFSVVALIQMDSRGKSSGVLITLFLP